MDTKMNWTEIFLPNIPWSECYPIVEAAARPHLANLPSGYTITTEQLADLIWPAVDCRGDENLLRPRLFRALEALSKHGLQTCVSFEEDTTSYWAQKLGKSVRRKRWHAPGLDNPSVRYTDTATSLLSRVEALENETQTLRDLVEAIQKDIADMQKVVFTPAS